MDDKLFKRFEKATSKAKEAVYLMKEIPKIPGHSNHNFFYMKDNEPQKNSKIAKMIKPHIRHARKQRKVHRKKLDKPGKIFHTDTFDHLYLDGKSTYERKIDAIKRRTVDWDPYKSGDGAVAEIFNEATDSLNEGVRTGNIEEAFKGAKVMEGLDYSVADRPSVKRRLMKAYEKASVVDPRRALKYSEKVKSFLDRHPVSRDKKKSLDSYVTVVLSIIVGLVGLFFLLPNLTGNVIGNLTISTSNTLGVILFLMGLVGLFFISKNQT